MISLQTARRDAGLRVSDIARGAGIHPGTVRSLEAEPVLCPSFVLAAAAIHAADYLPSPNGGNGNGNGYDAGDRWVIGHLLRQLDHLSQRLEQLEYEPARSRHS